MADKIELSVLRFIADNGPSTMLDMAGALGVATAEMNDILREGVRSNFIGRDYDKESKSIIYMLARRGRDALEEHDLAQQIKQRDPDHLLERIADLEERISLSESSLAAAAGLIGEFIAADDGKAQFMVSVDGASAPRHIHGTEDEARAEAMRIAHMNNNLTKTIRVLKLVDTLNVSSNTVKTATWSSGLEEGEAPANCTEQCGHCKEACRA